MKKQKIAICDQDVEYTRQLVNYIAAKEKDSFEVTGFSDESLYRKNDETRCCWKYSFKNFLP